MSLLLSWLGLEHLKAKMKPSILEPPVPQVTLKSLKMVEKTDVMETQRQVKKKQLIHAFCQVVVTTHAELLKLPNLRPGEKINELLGNLVSICCEIHDRDTVRQIVTHPEVQQILPSLRNICASAESSLESYWVEQILFSGSSHPDDVFLRLQEQFPYFSNYEELTRLELCAIFSATNASPQKIAFLGSGPLPLTSLCLLSMLRNKSDSLINSMTSSPCRGTQGPAVVLNVDYDHSAIQISTALSQALGPRGEGMLFQHGEAGSAAHNLADADVVYMAALVGVSQAEKEDILIKVASQMSSGALLVIRSSWGLRKCLYAEVDISTDRLAERLEPCVVLHPYSKVVNSVVVAKVR